MFNVKYFVTLKEVSLDREPSLSNCSLSYNGCFQVHMYFGPLDEIANCFNQLVIVNEGGCHFMCQNRS